MMTKLGAAFVLIAAGCTASGESTTTSPATGDDSAGVPAGMEPGSGSGSDELEPPLPYPRIFFTTSDGEEPLNTLFDARAEVYLNANATRVLPAPPVVPGDFIFEVTAGGGADARIASTDDPDCRRVHIDAAGQIDVVYAGAAGCAHPTVVDATGQGNLMVQLAPYLSSPLYGDLEIGFYCVTLTRAEPVEGGGSDTNGYCFFVHNTCGDERVATTEECDDGNGADGDGCSASCTIEHHCDDGCPDHHEMCSSPGE